MNKQGPHYRYAISDKEADRFFEEIEAAENFIDQKSLIDRHGDEQYTYEATPYSYILDFLSKFSPRKEEIVYDLGSGYGRFVIFCAMNSEARFKGIEISRDRNTNAMRLAEKLALENVEFLTGNVLDFDISDGDIFFLFNPFKSRTLEQIGEKLRNIAETKQIKIATWGGASDEYFLNRDWLQEVSELNPETPIEYFISKNIC